MSVACSHNISPY